MIEMNERENNNPGNRDFLKGTLFGILLSVTVLLAVFLFRYGTLRYGNRAGGARQISSGETVRKLTKISELIEDYYLFEPDPEELEKWMFKGIAAGLQDTYADYYTADEMDEIRKQNEGTYRGLGVTLAADTDTGSVVIQSVFDNSPASEAGLREGDIVVKVQDTETDGMSPADISALGRELKDEPVMLTVLSGEETLTFSMEQREIEMMPVTGEMMDESVGYIRIPQFDMAAVSQFESVVADLQEQGMKGLVIDLQDNPGGVLDSVCAILDDLLPEGVIVSTSTKEGKQNELLSDEKQIFTGPMAVLINQSSASASELFAGTFQDYELGKVVGETSYGKGVVQKTWSLQDGSAFKMTTEKYFTAKGRDIDGTGVVPDIGISEEEDAAARGQREVKEALEQGR